MNITSKFYAEIASYKSEKRQAICNYEKYIHPTDYARCKYDHCDSTQY